jgi:hypothetical protein
VMAPQELRQFRLETGCESKFILVSIEPVILQHMVAGCRAGNPFELTRTRERPDPALTDLLLRLQAEVTAGCPAGRLLAESMSVPSSPSNCSSAIRSASPALTIQRRPLRRTAAVGTRIH